MSDFKTTPSLAETIKHNLDGMIMNTEEAAKLDKSIKRFLEIRRLIQTNSKQKWPHGDKRAFIDLFSDYYKIRGIGDELKQRYFEILFDYERRYPRYKIEPPYRDILRKLHKIPANKDGKRTVQLSFVSKLVATYDETQPIYDDIVAKSFGFPVLRGKWGWNIDVTIDYCIFTLDKLRDIYGEWISDDTIMGAIGTLKERYPKLRTCHDRRICDLAVWVAGKDS